MPDLFNKHIKKATARTKERLLEGLGKAKATQDEAFEFHASNLTKQAKACEQLHKDLKAYALALKRVTEAEKALRDSIRGAYETEWPDREHVVSLTNSLDIQSDELDKKVNEDIAGTVAQYVAQFADLKKKVEKRGRKLVDYDHAKNTFNSLKASSKKGDADPKLTKAATELTQSQTLYKELNDELLEVLPATYDSRITFLVDTLQSLFNAQSQHQSESSRLNKQLVTQLDVLGKSMDSLRVARPEGLSTTPTRDQSPTRDNDSPTSLAPPDATPPQQVSPAPRTTAGDSKRSSFADTSSIAAAPTPTPTPTARKTAPVDEEKCDAALYPKLGATPTGPPKEKEETPSEKSASEKAKSSNPFDESDDDDGAEKIDMPLANKDSRKTLYTVRSTHEYKAVDADELSFDADQVIKVLESSPADQLDDGWLLGCKEDGTIGVFPENFTKKE